MAMMWEREKGGLEWATLKENWWLICLLGVGHAFSSGFENLALARVSLSLTQMVKSLAPGTVMVFSSWRMGKTYSDKMKFILLLQILGATLAVYHNPEFDFLFSMFCALSAVLVSERLMQRSHSPMSPFQLTFFSSVPGMVALMALMKGDELSRLQEVAKAGQLSLILVFATTVVALFYTCSQYMVIQCTNALYSQVIGNFRTALLVVLAIYIFGEHLTFVNEVGVVVGIVAFIAYSVEKFQMGLEGN